MSEYDQLFTLKEMRDYLKISETTALKLLKGGKIKAKKLGGQWRIFKSEVDNYLKDFDNK